MGVCALDSLDSALVPTSLVFMLLMGSESKLLTIHFCNTLTTSSIKKPSIKKISDHFHYYQYSFIYFLKLSKDLKNSTLRLPWFELIISTLNIFKEK